MLAIPFLDESKCSGLERMVLMLLKRVEDLEHQLDTVKSDLEKEFKARIILVVRCGGRAHNFFMEMLAVKLGINNKEYNAHTRICNKTYLEICKNKIDQLYGVKLDDVIENIHKIDIYLGERINVREIIEKMSVVEVKAYENWIHT